VACFVRSMFNASVETVRRAAEDLRSSTRVSSGSEPIQPPIYYGGMIKFGRGKCGQMEGAGRDRRI
jgi:hypothetical protein